MRPFRHNDRCLFRASAHDAIRGGSLTDVAARIVAEYMRPLLGQAVVVENIGGARGRIGVGRVAPEG